MTNLAKSKNNIKLLRNFLKEIIDREKIMISVFFILIFICYLLSSSVPCFLLGLNVK